MLVLVLGANYCVVAMPCLLPCVTMASAKNQTLLHYAKISILKLVLEKNRNSLFQYANN